MKQTIFTALTLLLSFGAYAQFTSPSVVLHHDQNKTSKSKSHGKAVNNPKQCGTDTIDYGYEKLIANLYVNASSSTLRAINISDGYRLGQFYTAPGEVTISGFKFYAWSLDTTAHAIDVYCEIYEAGADSLPFGNPVRADTLQIDTTFRNGVLDSISQFANFKPYTTTKPFIVVVRSFDSTRVAIVGNDYTKRDGFGENYACGSIGGRWYRCLDLNIGGTTLDCDMLLEPFVDYKLYNDFKLTDCYDPKDSVFFENTSSPFLFSPQYNIYKFYEEFRGYSYERFSHRWSYGGGFFYSQIDGGTRFQTPVNVNIGLRSILYSMTGSRACEDTTIKELNFQPEKVKITGDVAVCSGELSSLIASSAGSISWYKGPFDTTVIADTRDYTSPAPLVKNDTLYAQAVNKECKTIRTRQIVQVTETPTAPTIKDDSICLNSMANLVATSSVGNTRWFEDSTTLIAVHSGDFYQIGPLKRDTFFFAKTYNGSCTHDGRLKVNAFVSDGFAPEEPSISKDTNICLLSDDLTLNASGSSTLRWYDVAAGGTPIEYGDTHVFSPIKRGEFYRYVDAYNGICASSRLPIKIQVQHFPTLPTLVDQSACEGEDVLMEFPNIHGNVLWYDAETNGNLVHTGTMQLFPSINASQSFYLQPFEGSCVDTVRHKWSFTSIPYGKITSSTLDDQACDLMIPTLTVTPDLGEVTWFDEDENEIFKGNSLTTSPIESDVTVHYSINNQGCITDKVPHTVKWRVMPDANFDYQVVWRDVTFASRLIDQGDYIWEFGDNSDTSMGTDVTHHYYEDGTYDVALMVQSPFDCIDTVTKKITINSLNVNSVRETPAIVYPNPTKGLVTVDITLDIDRVEVVNAHGQIVIDFVLNGMEERVSIDFSALSVAEGVYYIKTIGNDEIRIAKVVYQK